MAKRTDDWARAAEVNKEMIAKDLNMMKERMDEFLLSTTTIVVCRKKTLLGFWKRGRKGFPSAVCFTSQQVQAHMWQQVTVYRSAHHLRC